MEMPHELNFLNPFFVDSKCKLQRADWLKSSFHDNVWHYNFDYKRDKTLNWSVDLDDGSILTDRKNNDLLAGLKYMLTSATEKVAGGGADSNSIKSQAINFARAVHVIDYLLLHSAEY